MSLDADGFVIRGPLKMRVKGEKEPQPAYVALDGEGFLAWYREDEGPRPKEGDGEGGEEREKDGGKEEEGEGEGGKEEEKGEEAEGAAEGAGAGAEDTPLGKADLTTALNILVEPAVFTIHVTFESKMPVFLNIGKVRKQRPPGVPPAHSNFPAATF